MLVDAKILSGDILELMQFNAADNGDDMPPRRSGKMKKSDEKQILRNLRRSRRHMARLINANFGARGICVGLDYDNEHLPQSFEAAVHQLTLFLRRLNGRLRRMGLANVKYIGVTETVTKDGYRLHHHVVLSPVAYALLKECWTLGGVTYEEMDRHTDYISIANYITKEKWGDRRYKKKWIQSKGLFVPQPKIKPAKKLGDIRIPKGFKELERTLEATEYGATIYIRAIRIEPPKKDSKKRRKEAVQHG